ncbi:GNAT family N-acetyltransferase [Chloroflexota bacterium]
MKKLVPPDFEVPQVLETSKFRLRMLTVHDVVKDYDAVMTSVDHLQGVFGPDDEWPEGLTLEENLIDMGWHHKEFLIRSSFAYTVVTPDESQILGCVYVDPTDKAGYDAEVFMWVRKSELDKGLDQDLLEAVKNWIDEKWPFKKVAYPGRAIDWETWESLKEEY